MYETVEEFLARGGKIQRIRMGLTKLSPVTGLPEKEHQRIVNSASKGNRKRKKRKAEDEDNDKNDFE